jgi:hypothetical protein
MYILTNDNYPNISERNKRIDVPRSVGEVAIYNGQATAAQRSQQRGSAQWLSEMAEIEAKRIPNPSDTSVPNNPGEWSVGQSGSNKPCIIYKHGSEVHMFDSPHCVFPAPVPEKVIRQFKDLNAATDATASANERERERARQ